MTSQTYPSAVPAPAAKIHVAHIMFSYGIGGMERVLADIMTARANSDVGYAVIIVNDSYNDDLVERLRKSGAEVWMLGRKQGSKSPLPLVRYLRMLRKHRVDVVHTRSLSAIPLAVAARIVRPNIQLFNSVHNTGILPAAKPWQIKVLKRLYRQNVAISKAVQAECLARGLTNVIVMNNAIDVARFAAAPRISAYVPGQRPFRVICVARYVLAQKAQDILLEAVALCHQRGLDVHCQLLGNLDGRNEQDLAFLKAQTVRLGLENAVEFVTNRTNVEDYLAQADLFVLPSRFEGFGNVVLEAAAAGTPVVVSKVDGLVEIISDDVNGRLVSPEDASGLADMIVWAATHPVDLARLARAGRASANGYDIGAYALAYERLYLDAIRDRGQSR